MVSPYKSASWTAGLTLHLYISTGTSKQSFGDFLVENFQWRVFLACFVMQDVCIDHYQVELMKEIFFPTILLSSFQMNNRPGSCLICPHQCYTSSSPTLRLVLFYEVPPLTWCLNKYIFMAVVRKKTSRMSFHLMAKRWSFWHDIFSPFFFQFSRKCLFRHFFFVWTSLCLQPLFCNPVNCRISLDWKTICPCTHSGLSPFILSHPVNNTERCVVFWVARVCPSLYI